MVQDGFGWMGGDGYKRGKGEVVIQSSSAPSVRVSSRMRSPSSYPGSALSHVGWRWTEVLAGVKRGVRALGLIGERFKPLTRLRLLGNVVP
jgi:hypothetical protein